MAQVAVLGAGNGGHAAAADLILEGNRVTLFEFPEFRNKIEPMMERGGIEITGAANVGFARLDKATTDIGEAVRDADVIVSTMVANAHKTIAKLSAPYLRDGQAIFLWGRGGGALVFRRVFKEISMRKKVLLAESNTLPYLCRVKAPALVHVFSLDGGKKDVPCAALPARDNTQAIDILKKLYPDRPNFFKAVENVLETLMADYNAITHPATELCNAGRIEYFKGNFPMWTEGFTQSVARLEAAYDEERLAIVKALRLRGISTSPIRSSNWIPSEWSNLPAPPIESRYVTEDMPCGLVTYSSLGDMLGVPTPVMKAIITTFEAMLGKEVGAFWKEGRTVQELGIAGMTVDEIHKLVE